MKRFYYLLAVIILMCGGALTAFAPDTLSMMIVAFMCLVAAGGMCWGIFPVIRFAIGLENGQKSVRRAGEVQTDSPWLAVSQQEKFFLQKALDGLFLEYRDKVQNQKESGQILSDIEEYINEDILGLMSWRSVIMQIPGIMTGIGILGTFVGLILGIREIGFGTVEAALSSVQQILAGIDTAFYTSIVGVILSILFNIFYNVLYNVMNRELGIFVMGFHRYVIPTVEEQKRYREYREARQVIELLSRIPKNKGFSLSNTRNQAYPEGGGGENEQILMPQILDGLKNSEFIFYLQPRYELKSRKIIGAEALVRWKHKTLGILSPSVFIPVLENNGYITKLDQYIWEEVCRMIRQWIDSGIRPLPVSVNVTKTDILAINVTGFFSGLLEKYRIPPRYLEIDIAENAYLQTHGAAFEVESSLQQKGFRVIVDGFRGDYLSLETVGRINASGLKLDLRYFDVNSQTETLAGVFEQARKLNLTVTAEGIENMEQLIALRKCGCSEGQGFYFSKPMEADEFVNQMSAKPEHTETQRSVRSKKPFAAGRLRGRGRVQK